MSSLPRINSTAQTHCPNCSYNLSIPPAQQGTALKVFRVLGLAMGGAMLFATYLQYRSKIAKNDSEYASWQQANQQNEIGYNHWINDTKNWISEINTHGQPIRARPIAPVPPQYPSS